jgi:hypothetical protein
MKPSADLFKLVQSLSKNEKRYVTLFLSSGLYKNNKNSLTLFRAIARQSKFDEAGLKKRLGTPFAKRFSAEKNKLFELILESLMFQYRDALPERKVVRDRLRSWALFHKGLRPLGWKYFRKNRAMAEAHEFYPQLAWLAYQENYETRVSAAEDVVFSSEKQYARNKAIVDGLSDDLTLHTLFTELIDLQKRHGNDMKQAMPHLERILKHPLVNPSRKLAAFSSAMSRLEIRALIFSMKGNHREAFDCFAEQIASIEKSKSRIEQNYVRYLNAHSNQLMHAALMRKYEIIPELARKTKKVNLGILDYFSFDINFNEFIGIRLYELIAFKSQADTGKGPALLSQMEKDFMRYRPQLRDTLIVGMLFIFGTYHFYLGNLKKSLQYFNDLFDSTDPEVGRNFQCMARLVKLVLHDELGHYDLLPSLSQSATRMIRKRENFGPFEKELISFFRRSTETHNRSALQKLLAVTRKHGGGHYSYGAWADFAFEAWIESRLKNKPFVKLIAEKQ